MLVLQIVDQPTDHLAVPETNYTFEALIKAQALGDFSAIEAAAPARAQSQPGQRCRERFKFID